MTNPGSLPHLDDAATLRLIDGELAEADAWMRDHARDCAECAERARALQTRSDDFSRTLGAVPIPHVSVDRLRPPHDDLTRRRMTRARSRWTRTGVRVAAGLVLAAGVAAASPLRGWIVEQIARVSRASTPVSPSGASPTLAPEADATAPGAGRPGTSSRSLPRAAFFALNFRSPPPEVTSCSRPRREGR